MDGYELPANPDHWDDGDKLTHTARLLQQAERERDEALAMLERAIASATESDTRFVGMQRRALDAEAERDAARAQVAALQDALQEVHRWTSESGAPERWTDEMVIGSVHARSGEALALVEDT